MLEQELRRGMSELGSKGKPPPYYIAYEIHDRNDVTVAASYGALVQSSTRHTRILDTDVRVGQLQAGFDPHDPLERLRFFVGDGRSSRGAAAVRRPVGAAHRGVARDRPPLQRRGRAAGQDQDAADIESGGRRSVRRFLAREARELPRNTGDAGGRRPRLGAAHPPAVGAFSRPAGHPGLGRDDAGVQPDALAGQLRRHHRADGPQLRAGVPGGEHARGRRHGAGALRDVRRRGDGGAGKQRRDGEGRRHHHRRPAGAAEGAARRSVHRTGHPGRARRGRVLPRDLRSPRRGAPPEERGGRADVRQEDRRADHAGVRVGVRRSDAVAAGRRGSERLLSLRRRRRGGAARDAGHRTAC